MKFLAIAGVVFLTIVFMALGGDDTFIGKIFGWVVPVGIVVAIMAFENKKE